MKKIKITSKQYNTILLNEQKNRLDSSKVEINESLNENIALIEEGFKDVLLGVAMLLGVGLTGANEVAAQNALKNDSTMSEIKSTLEDENKTKELAKAFAEKGMKDPDTLMAKNAKKVVDKFNKLAAENDLSYKVSNKVVDNLESLSDELKGGYAIKKADIKKDTIKAETKMKKVTIVDTIDVTFGNDKAFVTGGYMLNSDGVKDITSAIDGIKAENGKILSAMIESSTDAEQVPKYKSNEDPTGNIKLATLRTKTIADLLQNLDDSIHITHREIPNNGSDVVSSKQFLSASTNKEELNKLRSKTSDFRYVKLSMVVEFEKEVEEETKPEEVVKNYRFELVKVFNIGDQTRSGSSIFKHKKLKCGGKTSKKIKCFSF